MRLLLIVQILALLAAVPAFADIPAAPVMTYYVFGARSDLPYYTVESFERNGPRDPAGSLAQGSSVIPCLVIRDGRPLTDASGSPYVGFELVVDARTATRESTKAFKAALERQAAATAANHHCAAGVKHVLDVRSLFPLGKPPFFDPPSPKGAARAARDAGTRSPVDAAVRLFHNSPQCEEANRELIGRREALLRAWERFISARRGAIPPETLERARHLDATMRTAIYEGHLDRGCSAYGACERNVIALSIRNRARGACSRGQGCAFPGDFEGAATTVSQYNIWDDFLTQISGLTSCFLRDDLQQAPPGIGEADYNADYYLRIGRMYEQNVGDVEKILFGDGEALASVFPRTPSGDLLTMRHYYHPPAMRKCFPQYPRVDYITGAVARSGDDFALIANRRIEAGERIEGGYRFKTFDFTIAGDEDVVTIEDRYPGFLLDARKVSPGGSSGCVPYGIPGGCSSGRVGRYRTVPGWLRAGRPVAIACATSERGAGCDATARPAEAAVGRPCDKEMVPVAGVR